MNLAAEKQKKIIDAALKSFGTNGYKKTSVSDIAAAAGISKAMVFHYFGTKKDLYLYLVNFSGNTIVNEIKEKFDNTITDFFERIRVASEIKVSAIKKHSSILEFLTSAYFENDEEVKEEIQDIFASGDDFRNQIAFEGTDYSKFKEGVDLKLLMKMLVWMGEGFGKQLSSHEEFDIEKLCAEFYECLDLLKDNFYKEEYVKPKK